MQHTAHSTEHTALAALKLTISSGFTYCRFLYQLWIRAFWSSQGPDSPCPRQSRLFELFWETLQNPRKCCPLPELCWAIRLCQEPADAWSWIEKEQAGYSADMGWLTYVSPLEYPFPGNYEKLTELIWSGCQFGYGGKPPGWSPVFPAFESHVLCRRFPVL